MSELTQKRLKELLRYDHQSGRFIWIYSTSNRIKAGDKAGGQSLSNGYRRINVDGKSYREHNLVWLYCHGTWPNPELDHINGKRNDNRISNLREVTRTENTRNKQIQSNNTSGLFGVHLNKKRGIWTARIKIKGEEVFLGSSKNLFEACCYRKSAENKYNFHENHGRLS